MTAPVLTRGAALDALASDIRREVDAAEADFQSAVQHAIRAGELLIEAKAQVKHGEWLEWLGTNFSFTDRTASTYMRLAANRKLVSDSSTIRDAPDALAGPKEARESSGRFRRMNATGYYGIPARDPRLVHPNAPDKPHPKYLAASNDPWVTVCPCCGHDLYAPMAPAEP